MDTPAGFISADPHVVEPAEVFAGLIDRFGDEAPRRVDHHGFPDVMAVPARKIYGLPPARLGVAGFRLDEDFKFDPTSGAKPEPRLISTARRVATGPPTSLQPSKATGPAS